MANAVSKCDFTIPWATFLATAIGDGTFADILSTLKTDEPGEIADATDIEFYCGQLWSNLGDDFLAAVYQNHPGLKSYTHASTNATPTAAITFPTYTADGETWRYEGIATASEDGSAANRASCKFSATIVRTATTVFTILDPVSTVVDSGLPAMACALAQVGATNDIALYITGIAGTNITWNIRVTMAEQVV